MDLEDGGSIIQTHPILPPPAFTHLENRQEMDLCRNVITKCLNNDPRALWWQWLDLL